MMQTMDNNQNDTQLNVFNIKNVLRRNMKYWCFIFTKNEKLLQWTEEYAMNEWNHKMSHITSIQGVTIQTLTLLNHNFHFWIQGEQMNERKKNNNNTQINK